MSSLADLASIATAGATCVALVFAGSELRRSRAHDLRKRRVEIEGVAVSWVPLEAPRAAEDASGQAVWRYEFTACNPGPLPISDVRAEITFALKVQRVRHDEHLDDPVDRLVLVTPVLQGGGQRTWHRTLVMNYADGHEKLPRTRATISFLDPDEPQRRQCNYWPKTMPDVARTHAPDAAATSERDS